MRRIETRHRLTVEEYVGLDIDQKTELIDGLVYGVPERNAAHRNAVNALAKRLIRELGDRYTVQVRDAVATSGGRGASAPIIDVAVIASGYIDPLPSARNTFAAIEISDSTYEWDRMKIGLYVSAGIRGYIVNIENRMVERYETGADLAMPSGRASVLGETFEVLGVRIAVSDLFAPVSS